jgi:uncharacterized protein
VKLLRPLLLLAAVLLAGGALAAAERIPPAPARYFNDYAGVVSRPVADRLNAQLEQFERASSNQLLVAIYPKMESNSSVEDYTVRVAQAWRAGQAGKNNGAVLFSFMSEHKLYLQVGYGLESVLPDATAKRIIEREIVPRFRARDIDGGMTAAVNAMIAAAKGEYQGTGRTVADSRHSNNISPGALLGIMFFIWVAFLFARRGFNRPSVFMNPRRNVGTNTWWIGGGGSSGGGSSGGGGFSGGGGSFGGGGAGGSW